MDHDVDQKFELHPTTTLETTSSSVASNGGGDNNDVATKSASSTSRNSEGNGAAKTASTSGPIPMSMPSILRNPGVSQSKNHLASYLLDRHSSSYPPSSSSRAKSRPAGGGSSKELGRRKQRRSENARLLSNPHAVRPTLKDYRLHSNDIKSTFPTNSVLSTSKTTSIPVPSNSGIHSSEPSYDAASATAGHFGKSLKDAQRVLKRLEMGNISDEMIRQGKAGELERFIWFVDREIRTWAEDDIHIFQPGQQGTGAEDRKLGRVLLDQQFNFTSPPPLSPSDPSSPSEQDTPSLSPPTVHLDTLRSSYPDPALLPGQLIQFQKTPNALVWLIHDPFLRLIVHCLARVSKCPSFSKDDVNRPGLRFTWVLNRNPLARRSRRGRRVSVSSSVASATIPPASQQPSARIPPSTTALPLGVRPLGAGVAGLGMDTPPTTDFDSQTETETEAETESELGVDTDLEHETTSNLSDSIVIVPNHQHRIITDIADQDDGEDAEVEVDFEANRRIDDPNVAQEEMDTDEEEAEILRRVRKWAIDNHRQRTTTSLQPQKAGHDDDEEDDSNTSTSRKPTPGLNSRSKPSKSITLSSSSPRPTKGEQAADTLLDHEEEDEQDADVTLTNHTIVEEDEEAEEV